MVDRARRRAGAGAWRCGCCSRDRFSEGLVGEARRIIREGLPGVRGCAVPSTTRWSEAHQERQDRPARGAGQLVARADVNGWTPSPGSSTRPPSPRGCHDMPANSPYRQTPEWFHLPVPAAPTLTRDGFCSVCRTAPMAICGDEVRICRNCLAVLWHLDRRPAATPKHRPPAEPLPKPRAPDAELVEAQGAEAPASSSEPPPGNPLEQVAQGGRAATSVP